MATPVVTNESRRSQAQRLLEAFIEDRKREQRPDEMQGLAAIQEFLEVMRAAPPSPYAEAIEEMMAKRDAARARRDDAARSASVADAMFQPADGSRQIAAASMTDGISRVEDAIVDLYDQAVVHVQVAQRQAATIDNVLAELRTSSKIALAGVGIGVIGTLVAIWIAVAR